MKAKSTRLSESPARAKHASLGAFEPGGSDRRQDLPQRRGHQQNRPLQVQEPVRGRNLPELQPPHPPHGN